MIGALAHGLPLVTIPMGADQPLNAARCEALGVGLAALPGPEHAVALLARLVRE